MVLIFTVLIIHFYVFIHFSRFYNEPYIIWKFNIATIEFIPKQPLKYIKPSYFVMAESWDSSDTTNNYFYKRTNWQRVRNSFFVYFFFRAIFINKNNNINTYQRVIIEDWRVNGIRFDRSNCVRWWNFVFVTW